VDQYSSSDKCATKLDHKVTLCSIMFTEIFYHLCVYSFFPAWLADMTYRLCVAVTMTGACYEAHAMVAVSCVGSYELSYAERRCTKHVEHSQRRHLHVALWPMCLDHAEVQMSLVTLGLFHVHVC
jgi:hypothetical protein